MQTNYDMEIQSLKIKSASENITEVEQLIDLVCEELKVNESNYGNILVAITEAVNNAMQHGNKGDKNKFIDITCNPVSNDKIEFVIKDEGTGFDYNSLPDPTAPENIEKESGRGIFLMKNLADEISFDDNGRAVKLTFNLSKN